MRKDPSHQLFSEIPEITENTTVAISVFAEYRQNSSLVRLECAADNSNIEGNQKFISPHQNQSITHSINVRFNSSGKQIIACQSIDSNDVVSSTSSLEVIVLPAINQPPSTPALNSPVDGAENISAVTGLSWSTSNDPEGDSVHYDVYLDEESPPKTNILSNSMNTVHNTSALNAGTRYFWQVYATDSAGNISKSAVRSFRTTGNSDNTNCGIDWACMINPANGEVLTEAKDYDSNGDYQIDGWCSNSNAKIRVFLNNDSLNGTSGSIDCTSGSWLKKSR